VAGVMVSIAAFQAVDPGSIPGPRIFLCWGQIHDNASGFVYSFCQESELAQRFSALGS
jgi:hypothetical protein